MALRALAAFCALALGVAACSGETIETGLPAAAAGSEAPEGLPWLSRAALDGFLRFQAFREVNPGYVSMFARDGHVVYATAVGAADLEAERAMTLDTRFRLASMTKPVTAVAAHILIEEGRLSLDDPVARYIPAAARLEVATSESADEDGRIPTQPLAAPMTVRHLLTFSSGIGNAYGDSDLHRVWAEHSIYSGSGDLAARVDRMLEAPLYEAPGERWRYGFSADALARVVEVVAGEPFGRFVSRRILEPLSMTSTSFLPPEEDRSRLATMYQPGEDVGIERYEFPEAEHWTPGGSGLVGTVGDYMRFALMLWNGGEYDGVRILSAATVAEMTRAHVTSGVLTGEGVEGLGWGLGLAVVVDADATLTPDRTGDFWWAGAYGTTFFVSPTTGLVGVTATHNRMTDRRETPYTVYLAQAFAFFGL